MLVFPTDVLIAKYGYCSFTFKQMLPEMEHQIEYYDTQIMQPFFE